VIAADLARAGGDAERFRVAAAELPLSIGSVSVIEGTAGWPARLTEAAREMPKRGTLMIAEPSAIAPRDLEALAEVPLPCIVERSRLRPLPRAARDAASCVRAVVVEAALPAEGASAWLRDAVGWGRVLAGPLKMSASTRTPSSVLALLTARGGVPVTLLASQTTGRPSIVARSLGEHRVEVRVDADGTAIRIASVRGELTLPREHESSARAALRRVGAVDAPDLPDLRHDERIRASLLERA
jgi:hypothetical protein